MDSDKENKFIELTRMADREAYAELVRVYSGRVFAICLAIVGDKHDAEDIAQQTLLKGFTEINRLRNTRLFGAWIAQIARNLCIDFLRAKKVSTNTRIFLPKQQPPELNGHLELNAALAKLPQEYRATLMLYYFDGRSAASVAEVLSTSEQAVHTRLSRARKMLRKMLESQGDEL